MTLTYKKARTFVWAGLACIVAAILIDWQWGSTAIAATVALIFIVGGAVMTIIGIVWFLMNPMRRKT